MTTEDRTRAAERALSIDPGALVQQARLATERLRSDDTRGALALVISWPALLEDATVSGARVAAWKEVLASLEPVDVDASPHLGTSSSPDDRPRAGSRPPADSADDLPF